MLYGFTNRPTIDNIDNIDNIRLTNERMNKGMGTHDAVKADFLLKNVLLAGHCQDKTHLKPPNGLQLVLQVRNETYTYYH